MTDSTSLANASALAAPPPTWRPRPWRAAVLNIILPGWGQLYNGRPGRALGSYIAFAAGFVLTMAAASAAPARVLRIGLLVIAVTAPWVVLGWDGARVAARVSPMPRRWFQRWYVLLSVFALWAFLLHPDLSTLTKRYVTEAYRIPTGSMAPTLLVGDHVLVSKWDAASPARGDVVTFVSKTGHNFLQRVVGLPGDTLAMQSHRLLVNGEELDEPYARIAPDADPTDPDFAWQRQYLVNDRDSATSHTTLGTWGPIVIPAGHYFLLGDNRGSSYDSRYTGFVPASRIFGRARWIYYSRAPRGGDRRWSRVGVVVR